MARPRATYFVAPALVIAALAGCLGGPVFVASGSDARVISGYAYDGFGVRGVEGQLRVRLDADLNRGEVVAVVHDVLESFEIRFLTFDGPHPYQSGGVALGLELWGTTGNGSTVFPRVYAYAAAFGTASLDVDGVPQPDPTNLREGYSAYFFVTRGVYRDPESHLVYGGAPGKPYDPSRPSESAVNQIGGQATLLIYTSRGQVHRHIEFRDIEIERAR